MIPKIIKANKNCAYLLEGFKKELHGQVVNWNKSEAELNVMEDVYELVDYNVDHRSMQRNKDDLNSFLVHYSLDILQTWLMNMHALN